MVHLFLAFSTRRHGDHGVYTEKFDFSDRLLGAFQDPASCTGRLLEAEKILQPDASFPDQFPPSITGGRITDDSSDAVANQDDQAIANRAERVRRCRFGNARTRKSALLADSWRDRELFEKSLRNSEDFRPGEKLMCVAK